jgi:hypothetical protein
MRHSTLFLLFVSLFLLLQLLLQVDNSTKRSARMIARQEMSTISEHLGLSDLCLATDARYIRHLSLTDPVAPYMDHPGAVEHFPTGSFWRPVN